MVKVLNPRNQVFILYSKEKSNLLISFSFFYLAGNQRPPPKEPAPSEKPSEGSQPKPQPPGGRGAPPSPGGSWRGLEFKFTPGDKNSPFNNRTALAVLIGTGIAAYFAYNNTVYREITWKDFVSQYLLKGYVSNAVFRLNL